MTIRAVIDTNVFVSAIIGDKQSAPRLIYEAFKDDLFTSVTSQAVIDEIEEVLDRLPIRARFKLTDAQVKQFVNDFITVSAIVPSDRYVSVSQLIDPKDNIFVTCAVVGSADYIISGDTKHLLSLKEFEGIKIVSPRTFLDEVLG